MASKTKPQTDVQTPTTRVINNGKIYSQRLTTNAVNAPDGMTTKTYLKSKRLNLNETFVCFFNNLKLRRNVVK